MQVDVDSEVSGNENDTEAATPVNLDDGTLPSVTIGTEPWHEHVPVVITNLIVLWFLV